MAHADPVERGGRAFDRLVIGVAGAFLIAASIIALLTPAEPSSPREDDEAEVDSVPVSTMAAPSPSRPAPARADE